MDNTEESVELLKRFNPGDEYTGKIKQAIENILAEQEKLKDENTHFKLENIKLENLNKILNYELEDSIPKQKVKEGLEDIEDYFDRLNGPDEDIEYIRRIKKELLEDK